MAGDLIQYSRGFRSLLTLSHDRRAGGSSPHVKPASAFRAWPGIYSQRVVQIRNREDGTLTEWGSFSSLGIAQSRAAVAMKLPPGGLRLIAAYVGGSYGSKHITAVSHIIFYAAALAKTTRRPVAIFYTKEARRKEDFPGRQ